MYDTIEELLQKIRLGEDTTIEFKSVRFKGNKIDLSREDIADEIAAFANTADGVIVFGIDDKSKVIEGIPDFKIDFLETFICEIVNDTIKPAVSVRTVKLNLPGMAGEMLPVLKVDIPRSLFVHESPGGYFTRSGSSKRKLAPDALARLFQQRSQVRIIRFDEQPVPGTNRSDLNDKLWRRFSFNSSDPSEVILGKLKLITKDETGQWRLTVSGVLLCTDNPEIFIPNAIIESVAYRGTVKDSNYQNDAKTITGSLDAQVREAIKFVKANMKIRAVKDPGRIDIPQFSMRAVFEAVVNAVAHRDYSVYGSKIRLFVFNDRLEMYSPGTIPNSMTIESLPLRQSTRNELITNLIAKCRVDSDAIDTGRQYMMDKRGEGVPIIISESEKLSGKKPIYQMIDDSELLLTIYGNPESLLTFEQGSGLESDKKQTV
ncbi:MAG: RNA-binding domain-containing protein [Candidatus Desantisbacteria bacterium]